MEKMQAEAMAIEIIKLVVNSLSRKQFEEVSDITNLASLTIENITEIVNEYLELNKLKYIDAFGVKCGFNPNYAYKQINFYHYTNGTGFAADYDLTTDGELNDLTLQMEFLYGKGDLLTSYLVDLHVL